MELEKELKSAYEKFKNKVSPEVHSKFISLLQGVHQDVLDAIDGTRDDLPKSEFAHALSIIDSKLAGDRKIPTNAEELPTKVKPDGTLLGVGKWELLDPKWAGSTWKTDMLSVTAR